MTKQRMLRFICAAAVLLGAIGFLVGISGPQAHRAWQVYLINFVFWTGLAFGSVVFVAMLNLTRARWGRALKRLAEAPCAFLPVSFVLFWVLYLGREEIFPWIHEPVGGREDWLNAGFLFARDGFGLFLLSAVAMALVYYSLRAERPVGFKAGLAPAEMARTWESVSAGIEEEIATNWRLQNILSPILAILYALVLSLVAIDLIMSLDPRWYSTLFGAYYFVGSFYTALAALVILAGLYRKRGALRLIIQPCHFHDLGKLLLGFCLLTGDFFYSQFLVIWYGNLPEETQYVILRVRHAPWQPLAWSVLLICFGIPFAILLVRKIKLRPGPMMALAGVILVGMWLERLLLVAPSLWRGERLPIGLFPEVLITVGYLGAAAWTIVYFLDRYPPVPLSDPLFAEALKGVTLEGNSDFRTASLENTFESRALMDTGIEL